MGHGRAKTTSGLSVIKWMIKALLCSTALIALCIGYSIAGAFLFQAIENTFKNHNAQQSLLDRDAYVQRATYLVDELCESIRIEQRKRFENADTLGNETLVALANSTLNGTSQIGQNDTTTTTEEPRPDWNYTLPSICQNSSHVLDKNLRDYEDNLTKSHGWRFRFRDNDFSGVKWNVADGLLYSVTVITTIGYGNLVPKTLFGRIATMLYAMLGIPLMLLCLAYIGNIWANVLRLIYTAFYRCCQKCKRANKRKTGKLDVSNKKGAVQHDNTNGSVDPEIAAQSPDEEEEEIPVPAWLAFLILIAYLAGGSLLFSEWEGWSYANSVYFCFITFSTIGFGDIVPGYSISESDPQRAAMCAIYIMFGLATMSMVISVIQEDVIRVVYRLGNRIGLTKNKKPSG